MIKKPVIVKREIKLAYIEQILLKKLTASEAAKELNVREATVYDWLKSIVKTQKISCPEAENKSLQMRKCQEYSGKISS